MDDQYYFLSDSSVIQSKRYSDMSSTKSDPTRTGSESEATLATDELNEYSAEFYHIKDGDGQESDEVASTNCSSLRNKTRILTPLNVCTLFDHTVKSSNAEALAATNSGESYLDQVGLVDSKQDAEYSEDDLKRTRLEDSLKPAANAPIPDVNHAISDDNEAAHIIITSTTTKVIESEENADCDEHGWEDEEESAAESNADAHVDLHDERINDNPSFSNPNETDFDMLTAAAHSVRSVSSIEELDSLLFSSTDVERGERYSDLRDMHNIDDSSENFPDAYESGYSHLSDGSDNTDLSSDGEFEEHPAPRQSTTAPTFDSDNGGPSLTGRRASFTNSILPRRVSWSVDQSFENMGISRSLGGSGIDLAVLPPSRSASGKTHTDVLTDLGGHYEASLGSFGEEESEFKDAGELLSLPTQSTSSLSSSINLLQESENVAASIQQRRTFLYSAETEDVKDKGSMAPRPPPPSPDVVLRPAAHVLQNRKIRPGGAGIISKKSSVPRLRTRTNVPILSRETVGKEKFEELQKVEAKRGVYDTIRRVSAVWNEQMTEQSLAKILRAISAAVEGKQIKSAKEFLNDKMDILIGIATSTVVIGSVFVGVCSWVDGHGRDVIGLRSKIYQ